MIIFVESQDICSDGRNQVKAKGLLQVEEAHSLVEGHLSQLPKGTNPFLVLHSSSYFLTLTVV
jgi:hypothetical protein